MNSTRRTWILFGATLAGASGMAVAQRNRMEFRASRPSWVMAGQTVPVQIYGQGLAPKEIRFADPAFTAKVMKTGPFSGKNDQERKWGNTQVDAEVNVPANAKPGHYRFTLTGENVEPVDGVLVVDVPAPEINETEPNQDLRKPQVLPAGSVTINGKLDNEGADVFQINGKAGEVWRFEVFAQRIKPDNKLEACLRLREGVHLAPVKTAVDQGEDCALEYKLPTDGPYLIELFDGDNKAGGDQVYRLAVRKL